MVKRKSIMSIFLVIAVLLISAAAFAETTDASDDASKEVSYGRFIMNRMRRLRRSDEEIDFEKVREMKTEKLNSMLSDLVEQGIITEEKAEVILEKYEEFIETVKSKIEERKTLFEQLVEEGILTEEERDAVKEALIEMKPEMPRPRMFNGENKTEVFKEALLKLVDEGLLTEDKVDEIVGFLEEKIAERQEIKDNGGFWQQLVDSGIITEEELEDIRENSNIKPMPRFKLKRGFRNIG